MTAARASSLTPARIVGRVAAGVVGGWAFVWGFSVLAITGLIALGWSYDDARTGVMLLAFIVYLVVFCWAFAAASLARVWSVLAGGAAVMTAAGWLLQRALV